MYAPSHTLTHKRDGWHLTIHEPAPKTLDRPLPYLYRVNLTFHSKVDALAYLAGHLEENGAIECKKLVAA